jgi:hypothetical protein
LPLRVRPRAPESPLRLIMINDSEVVRGPLGLIRKDEVAGLD